MLCRSRHEPTRGDIIKREVPQVTVSFVNHRMGLPVVTEAEPREGLKRLALNFLMGQALERILTLCTQRETLETLVKYPRDEMLPREKLYARISRYLTTI